jgi:hypothetical protein
MDMYAFNELSKFVIQRILEDWEKPEIRQQYPELMQRISEWIEDNLEYVQDVESYPLSRERAYA